MKQDKIRQYKAIQDNTIQYMQNNIIHDNTGQYKTIQDKTSSYNTRQDKTRQYNTT